MTCAPRPPPRPSPAPVSVPKRRPFSVTIRLKTSPTERTPSPGFQLYFPAMTRARPTNLSDSVPASLDNAACVVCARSGTRLSTAAIATAHAIVLVRIVLIDISFRQIFLRQRRSGRLGLHHDARHSPAGGFFDRFNAVDAARGLLAVGVQRVAAPYVRDVAVALNVKFQLLFFQHDVATSFDAGDPLVHGLERIGWRAVRAE